MFYKHSIKRLFKYSALIVAAYSAFCASGCAYSKDHWKIYLPAIQQESQIAFMTEKTWIADDSSDLMKMIEEEILKETKEKN